MAGGEGEGEEKDNDNETDDARVSDSVVMHNPWAGENTINTAWEPSNERLTWARRELSVGDSRSRCGNYMAKLEAIPRAWIPYRHWYGPGPAYVVEISRQ